MRQQSPYTDMKRGVLGWHFIGDSGRLRYYDERTPKRGMTLRGPRGAEMLYTAPKLCRCGFHASCRILDAMKYAPGERLARVRVSGKVAQASDKVCGTERKALTDYVGVFKTFREVAVKVVRRAMKASGENRKSVIRLFDKLSRGREWSDTDVNTYYTRDGNTSGITHGNFMDSLYRLFDATRRRCMSDLNVCMRLAAQVHRGREVEELEMYDCQFETVARELLGMKKKGARR